MLVTLAKLLPSCSGLNNSDPHPFQAIAIHPPDNNRKWTTEEDRVPQMWLQSHWGLFRGCWSQVNWSYHKISLSIQPYPFSFRGTIFLFNVARQYYSLLPIPVPRCSCIKFPSPQRNELLVATKDGTLLLIEYNGKNITLVQPLIKCESPPHFVSIN